MFKCWVTFSGASLFTPIDERWLLKIEGSDLSKTDILRYNKRSCLLLTEEKILKILLVGVEKSDCWKEVQLLLSKVRIISKLFFRCWVTLSGVSLFTLINERWLLKIKGCDLSKKDTLKQT